MPILRDVSGAGDWVASAMLLKLAGVDEEWMEDGWMDSWLVDWLIGKVRGSVLMVRNKNVDCCFD